MICPQCSSKLIEVDSHMINCSSCEYRVFEYEKNFLVEQFFFYPTPKERYMITRNKLGTGIHYKKCKPGATIEDLTGFNGIFHTEEIIPYSKFNTFEKIKLLILFS